MTLFSKSLSKQWENEVPKYVSSYVNSICLQFVQTILWVATIPQMPDWKETLFSLEMEFRNACSTKMNEKIRQQMESLFNQQSRISFSESFALQLWFDVSFAKQIMATNATNWNQTLKQISDRMDLVNFKSIENQLETEVRLVVNRCSLLFGTSHTLGSLFDNTTNNENKQPCLWRPKTMPRIQMLPIATYAVAVGKGDRSNDLRSLGELETNNRRMLARLSNTDSQTPTHFVSHAITRASSLFQNFNLGTVFK